MAKFVFMYIGGDMAATEAEQAASMQAWEKWLTSLGSAIIDMGNPFMPGSKRITAKGVEDNGPAESLASGYTVISADSMDQAIKMAQGCPGFSEGTDVTVYETYDAM